MNRYRKGLAAALGFVAQAALLLDEQLDAGTLPESWVPWARLVVAAATVVGVVWVRNAPATDGRHEDAGTARAALVTLVGFALASLLVVATLIAGPTEARSRAPRVTAARVCNGGVTVFLDFHGRRDVGVTDVQGLYVGAAAGPGGRWEPLATIGSEGARLWRISGRGVPLKVRAVDTISGAVSRGVEPVWGCAA